MKKIGYLMQNGFRKFIEKSGLAEVRILLIVLAVVSGILIFISIADKVVQGETQYFDNFILKSLRTENDISQPAFPGWITSLMINITALGSETIIVFITVFVSGYLILKKKYYWLSVLLIATLGGVLLELGLKELIGRTRPTIVTHLLEVNSTSFPSGHSMVSAIVYLTQAALLSRIIKDRKIKIYLIFFALLLTFLIGISRIYIGVHYPTDVLAGWTAGISWALICWYAASLFEQGKKA
jgi:undecaprenyl-diphosphatase